MTVRPTAVLRTVLVLAIAAGIGLVPAVAQKSINDRNATNTLRAKSTPAVPGADEEKASVQSTRGYARSNYLWPYHVGPAYGVPNAAEPGVFATTSGWFQLRKALDLPTELLTESRLDVKGVDHQYFVVHYDSNAVTEDDLRSIIEATGGAFIESTSDAMMSVRLTRTGHEAIRSAVGVLTVVPYHAAFKLEPMIGRIALPDPVRAMSDVYSLEVQLWPGEDSVRTAQYVTALGGAVRADYGDTLVIEINRSALGKLAQIEAVKAISESLPRLVQGEETTTTMQTGNYNAGAIPFHDAGVDGGGGGSPIAGQVLMVLDSGISLDAGDLSHKRIDAGTPCDNVNVACGAQGLHRKVLDYKATSTFTGGGGDTSGCDAPAQGGFTHGHVVSATALGNATKVDLVTYGTGWFAFDTLGNPWKLDGVAPKAKLIAYDGQTTPVNGSCADPLLSGITPGDLYNSTGAGNARGSMGVAFEAYGARVFNFSWGSASNTYSADAQDIDTLMRNKPEAIAFVAAGNNSIDDNEDGLPDQGTLGAPATTRNGVAVGASRNANTVNSPESREAFSSVGPAVNTTVNRVAPQLMAPGGEPGAGSLGISSEFACRSNDNNQTNPVTCDIISGAEGTSFSSPAAAGSALLVRDYFAQGFYPNAVRTVAASKSITGSLTKAVLIASADYMSGANLTCQIAGLKCNRFNNEQGYGRIELDLALPLETWPRSPTGIIVHDPGALPGGLSNLTLASGVTTNQTTTATFRVCNDTDELRVALAWADPVSASPNLRNNLDLQIKSPTGKVYRGNYFTDDSDQNGVLAATEDCPPLDGLTPNNEVDEGEWSLPVCANSKVLGQSLVVNAFDNANPTEAIFLSPDPDADNLSNEGTCTAGSSKNANGPCNNSLDCRTTPAAAGDCVNPAGYRQTELGDWTITVVGSGTITSPPQTFAVAIAGGVCLGSSVRFDLGAYACNERAKITVTELAETGAFPDNPTATDVKNRTTVEVLDGTNTVVDTETGITFTQPTPSQLIFVSNDVLLSGNTARDPGNGVLDVRHGDTLRVRYMDKNVTTGALTIQRTNIATVNCDVDIGFGNIVFAQYGKDTNVFVQGGCERNVRNKFEFGFPDRYMDANEQIIFNFGFNSNESIDLDNVQASLKCVNVDADSPKGCLPSGTGCGLSDDPKRTNNSACTWMTIVDSPKILGFVPAGSAIAANFDVVMAGDGVGQPFQGQPTPTVEMILEVSAAVNGKTSAGMAIFRQKLNVDDQATLYSTDFPSGGSEVLDMGPGTSGNNDEISSNPVTEFSNYQGNDYRFESMTYGSLIATGKNLNLLSPWNFDGDNGGMINGLAGPADSVAANSFNIGNWGEDKNFNGIEDGVCSGGPAAKNGLACYNFAGDARCGGGTCTTQENNLGPTGGFVNNWNTKGGCGWQTKPPLGCSADTTRGCFDVSDCRGVCKVTTNPIVSSFAACGAGAPALPACPPVKACKSTSTVNPLEKCNTDADCDGTATSCDTNVGQTCVADGGNCSGAAFATGGVWHTGQIGTTAAVCNGSATSACANYKVIAGVGGVLNWWELLATPVMEKVNQGVGGDGLPLYRVEIFDMSWNAAVNLRDDLVEYTWEVDTDLASLDPVDLFADSTILGGAVGGSGAVANTNNADLSRGYNVFAPVSKCTPSNKPCEITADCPAGSCDGGGGGGALGLTCHFDSECAALALGSTCVGEETCAVDAGGLSQNGTLGNNRQGKNSCFFEGAGKIPPGALGKLGLANPPDDDQNNDLKTCSSPDPTTGMPIVCNNNKDCAVKSAGTCNATGDVAVDEFVTPAGPYRNHDITAWNGPDMRFATLEDIYGDTGNTFQAALGFVVFEGTAGAQAQQSYGLAVDDLVIKWKEITQVPDASNCTGGTCAVLELSTSNVFEGQTVLTINAFDSVTDPGNDCDLSGTVDPPGNDQDCDNDGAKDIVVRVESEAEPTGEIVFLNAISPGSPIYRGFITISSLGNSPGTLFIAPAGADAPTVTVRYNDNDIDPGAPTVKCPNSVNPALAGVVVAATNIFFPALCDVTFIGPQNSDNGDHDLVVDTAETTNMKVRLLNNCGIDLHNCVARISSNDPNVACIIKPQISVGTLPKGSAVVVPTDAFIWRMANTSRSSATQDFSASFAATMVCDEIDGLSQPQTVSMQLDYDTNDLAQVPAAWEEGFESGTLGKFQAENLDAGIPGANNTEGLANGNGWRCQYNDPSWPNSATYGSPNAADCYPGSTLAQSNAIFWHVEGTTTSSPDGGRAWNGSYSMFYGLYTPGASVNKFTTPLAEVESVRTTNPINLGVGFPELSFYQQISLVDYRSVNVPPLRAGDRGVLEVQEADNAGTPITPWTRLVPYQNSYDTQANDNYFNCLFDPVDDGNTEDNFFNPADPLRYYGPSSTCFPAFTWSWMGDTDQPFAASNVGDAPQPPSVTEDPTSNGGFGLGTWVKTKVDLSNYRAKRVRLRFLVTSIKVGTVEHWQSAFAFTSNAPFDDGWFIDKVIVDQTLANPGVITVDNDVVKGCNGNPAVGCLVNADCVNAGAGTLCNQAAPGCGATCTIGGLTVGITTTPDVTPGALVENLSSPGSTIEIDASSSSGLCLNGALQFKFSINGGAVLHDWTENPIYLDAPAADRDYKVEIRCTSDHACTKSSIVDVNVLCPSTNTLGGSWDPAGGNNDTVKAKCATGTGTPCATSNKTQFVWVSNLNYDVWRGTIKAFQGTCSGIPASHCVTNADCGSFVPPAGATCNAGSYSGAMLLNNQNGTSFTDPTAANTAGDGFYYVTRKHGDFCNNAGLWTECPNGADNNEDACEQHQSDLRENALP
jgi:hypothetical protein